MAADNVPQNTEGADQPPETGLHILPGGEACPELIEGATPDYTMQPENPTGAVIGFPAQEQTHFATDNLTGYQSAPAAFLQGQLLAWLFPCQGAIGPGVCHCPDTYSQKVNLTGDPGDYDVVVRIAGVSETNDYENGEQGNGWYVGGDPVSSAIRNTYKLEVSDPPQVLYLNPGAALVIQAWDYTNTIRMRAGAVLTISADSGDGTQLSNQANLTVPDVTGIMQPYNGQFMAMQILSATPVTS